ncbi:MAG: hypothetical protein K6G23_07315 [Lachnospiraceae bacterium]|nr:hypothetical protein [Lachnospiraceae bacterium]
MAEFMKKQGAGMYFNALAAILGVVGLIAAIICSNMTVTYRLGNMGQIAMLAIGGVVLCIAAICLPNYFGNRDIAGTVAVLGAIAVYAFAFGAVLSERILLIAGLFSYDSVNTVGWQVFSVTVVSIAAFLIGDIALIIGAFTKSVKEVTAE